MFVLGRSTTVTVLHQPLCLSRQARRIREVGRWTNMNFLDSWQMVFTALSLGCAIKRERNGFASVCAGLVHRYSRYRYPLCLWGSAAQQAVVEPSYLRGSSEGTAGVCSCWPGWFCSSGREDHWSPFKKLPLSRQLPSTSPLLLTLLFTLYSVVVVFYLQKVYSFCIFAIY